MKTLILGIGNEIKSDDAVGLIIARYISNKLKKKNVKIKEVSAGGLPLLNEILGYERVYIVDSVVTKDGNIGDWYSFPIEDLEVKEGGFVSHTVSLSKMIEIGKKLDVPVPKIILYVVEVKDPFKFGEGLTPEMLLVLPRLEREIMQSINKEIVNQNRYQ